jgi:hypothetical protein
VLLASGYIAGGAIAGIVIAFMAAALPWMDAALTHWSESNNPFFVGPYADVLSLIPFALLTLSLYLTGRKATSAPLGGNASVTNLGKRKALAPGTLR